MALGKLVLNCFPLASKSGDASVVGPVLSSQEPPIGPFVSDKLQELLWHHRPWAQKRGVSIKIAHLGGRRFTDRCGRGEAAYRTM